MLRITGKVQGVWYRKSAVEAARRSGITGYAMNLLDGSVQIEAEGQRGQLEAFVAWCQQGPPLARVDRVEVSEGIVQGFATFEARH